MMRELRRGDIPDLTRILHETGAFTPVEIECALELLSIVLDEPNQRDYVVIVAEDAGQVAGYVLYGPVPLTEGNFDIYWIATDPCLHGRGFGRRLITQAEEEAKQQGARLISLETSSQGGYARTRRFYLETGYLEECRIKDFYRPGDDRITYVKR